MKRPLLIFTALAVPLLVLAWFWLAPSAPAAAQMQPTPATSRLAPWPTVYPPSQADDGAQEYYQRCMVCHGDLGQGLTDEWRGALDPADQNCWQSGCHGGRVGVGGFEFPRFAPRVMGGGALARFVTAQELFDFIKAEMPFQSPGSLSDEIYWQLTAYLLRENGFHAGGGQLSEATAARVRLEHAQPPDPAAWWPFALGGLGIGVVMLVLLLRRR